LEAGGTYEATAALFVASGPISTYAAAGVAALTECTGYLVRKKTHRKEVDADSVKLIRSKSSP
jgi:hypothetical protein